MMEVGSTEMEAGSRKQGDGRWKFGEKK